MIEQLISIIAPHHCISCNKQGDLLCVYCSDTLPSAPSVAADSLTVPTYSATAYEEYAKELVYLLKFHRAKAAGAVMGGIIAQRLPDYMKHADIVTHMPTVPARARMRGYDQSALIAKSLSRQLGLPYASLLRRLGGGRQLGKTKQVRQQQMQHAFYTAAHASRFRTVLLVDDVITTGSTACAASEALLRAGVERVYVASFAAVA